MDPGLLKLGILLGIGAAAPIGPVNVEIARRTLRHGFATGFALGAGAVSVDVVYAVLSSQGLKRLIDRPAVAITLAVCGAAMLLYLAGACFRAAWKAVRNDPMDSAGNDDEPQTRLTIRGSYLTGVLLTLLNPLTIAFWFVAVPGALGPITQAPRRDLPMICAGVFVGTLAWVVLFAGLLALAGRYRKRWWLALADAAGGATLLGFAVLTLWRLRGSFL